MIISYYESYSQKSIVSIHPHEPRIFYYYEKKMQFSTGSVHISTKLYFSTKGRPANPQPLQAGMFYLFKLKRGSLTDEGNEQRETKG